MGMASILYQAISTDHSGHYNLNPLLLRDLARKRSSTEDTRRRTKFILSTIHRDLPSKIERGSIFQTIVGKTFPCYDVLILALHHLWNKQDGLKLDRKNPESTVSYASAYLTCVEDDGFLDRLPIHPLVFKESEQKRRDRVRYEMWQLTSSFGFGGKFPDHIVKY